MSSKKLQWYEQPEFLKLRKDWYQKLSDDDQYNDIEIIDWKNRGESGNLLLGLGKMDCIRMGRTRMQAAQRYYEIAEHWANYLDSLHGNSAAFRKPVKRCRDLRRAPRWPATLVRQVWRLHSTGESYRDIAKALGTYKQLIGDIIRRQSELMLQREKVGLSLDSQQLEALLEGIA